MRAHFYSYLITLSHAALTIANLKLLKGNGKTVEIIKEVAPYWLGFGGHLDFDPVGRDLDTIAKGNKDLSDACTAMFQHWLKGNGREATWDNLIEILEAVGLKFVAAKLRAIVY